MRLFRKLKRKFSKECKERFQYLKAVREHRCWLYSAKLYLYSNNDFEDDFKELSKTKSSKIDYKHRFLDCCFYRLSYKYSGISISNPTAYWFKENNKQFMRFWKVYSQAPFWKKYKVWLKKQEIDKDF